MQVPGRGVPLPLSTLPCPVGPPLAPSQALSLLHFLPRLGPAACPLPGAKGDANNSPGLAPQEGAPSTPLFLEPTARPGSHPSVVSLPVQLVEVGGAGKAESLLSCCPLSVGEGGVSPSALWPANHRAISFQPQTDPGRSHARGLFRRQETEDQRAPGTCLPRPALRREECGLPWRASPLPLPVPQLPPLPCGRVTELSIHSANIFCFF